MKLGDVVKVLTSKGLKYGLVVKPGKKKFMVGPVVEVLVDGEIQTFLREKVELIGEIKNES